VFLESLPPTLFVSVPLLDARRRSRYPLGQTTDMLLRRSFSAFEEVPTVRSSHLSEADTSGSLGHLGAVRSAYAVGNPMGSQANMVS